MSLLFVFLIDFKLACAPVVLCLVFKNLAELVKVAVQAGSLAKTDQSQVDTHDLKPVFFSICFKHHFQREMPRNPPLCSL